MVTRMWLARKGGMGTVVSPGWKPDIWCRMISCSFSYKFPWKLVKQVFLIGLGPVARRPFPWLFIFIAEWRAQSLMLRKKRAKLDKQCGQGIISGLWPASELWFTEQRKPEPSLDGGLGRASPAKKKTPEITLHWAFYGYFSPFIIHLSQATI
jgi:hypothetical protein